MGTSFEQFTAALRNEYARRAIGIDISNSEAERVVADSVLARAYYDNWLRVGSEVAPTPPFSDHAYAPASSPGYVAPVREAAISTPSVPAVAPYKLGPSIAGLVLSVVGYLLTGTLFSALGLLGLGLSIFVIFAAREAKPRQGWKAGLAMGIIGTVAGGASLVLFIAFLTGYYT